MARVAAIYARVSSDRQKESGTIASQTAALRERACKRGYVVPPEWVFEDDGFSGARLDRPGLEAVRDLAAEGRLEAVLVLSPDRLSRKYAYQVLLLEEFERSGGGVRVRADAGGGDAPAAPAGAGAGHDRRVRAGANHGAQPAGQALQGAPGFAERALGSAVRVPVREAERRNGGALRGLGAGSGGGAAGVRLVCAGSLQHRGDRAPADGAGDSDADRQATLGPLGDLGHAAQSGLLRAGRLRQDRGPARGRG